LPLFNFVASVVETVQAPTATMWSQSRDLG